MPTDIPSVEILGSAGVVAVTFTRPIGPLVSIPDGSPSSSVDIESVLGIDAADGTPYFNSMGALPAEVATLTVDTLGNATLGP